MPEDGCGGEVYKQLITGVICFRTGIKNMRGTALKAVTDNITAIYDGSMCIISNAPHRAPHRYWLQRTLPQSPPSHRGYEPFPANREKIQKNAGTSMISFPLDKTYHGCLSISWRTQGRWTPTAPKSRAGGSRQAPLKAIKRQGGLRCLQDVLESRMLKL